jgi:hypothetical protein
MEQLRQFEQQLATIDELRDDRAQRLSSGTRG